MWRRRDALALALIVVACRRDAPPPPSGPPVADASEDAGLDSAIADASRDRITDVNEIHELAQDEMARMLGYEREHIARVKSIGHTSVVLKLDMREGTKYAFKPRSKKGSSRYNGEIAAFRLGNLLRIDNVPKAYPSSFNRGELTAAADEKAAKLIADEVSPGDVVHGALIPWIADYAVLPLENDKEWRGWLKKDGAIPDDKKDVAAAISTMIVFDYVTGNWDRWSGANVATSGGREGRPGKVLFVDNDAAFFETPPKDALARNKRYLESVDRFSKTFIERLRAVTDEEIARAIDVLSEEHQKAIDGVLARRKEALAIVEKKELFFL